MKLIGPGKTKVPTPTDDDHPANGLVQTGQLSGGSSSASKAVNLINENIMRGGKKNDSKFTSGTSVHRGHSFNAISNSKSKEPLAPDMIDINSNKNQPRYKLNLAEEEEYQTITKRMVKRCAKRNVSNIILPFKETAITIENTFVPLKLRYDVRIRQEVLESAQAAKSENSAKESHEKLSKYSRYKLPRESRYFMRAAIDEEAKLRRMRVEQAEADRAPLVETHKSALQKRRDSWMRVDAKIFARIESYNQQQKNSAVATLDANSKKLLRAVHFRGMNIEAEFDQLYKLVDKLASYDGCDIDQTDVDITYHLEHIEDIIDETEKLFSALPEKLDSKECGKSEKNIEVEGVASNIEVKNFDSNSYVGEMKSFDGFENSMKRSAAWAAMPDEIKGQFLDFNIRMSKYESVRVLEDALNDMKILLGVCFKDPKKLQPGSDVRAKVMAGLEALRNSYLAPLIDELGDFGDQSLEERLV